MLLIETLVRWLHLMAAVIWVGSLVFTTLVVQPILCKNLPTELRLKIYREIGKRFTAVMWVCWAVLLATGAFYLRQMRMTPLFFRDSPFGRVLMAKFCLIAMMMALSLLHAYVWGPRRAELGHAHPDFAELSRKMSFWGRVNFALVMGIVLCAAMLRMELF